MALPELNRYSAAPARSIMLRLGWRDRVHYRLPNWAAVFHPSNTRFLALVDQTVVSATSFLTSLLVGRFAGASQLGFYAIGVTVFASVFTMHGALLAQPYAVHRHRPLGSPAEDAGGTLMLCGMLSTITALSLVLLDLALFLGGAQRDILVAVLVFASILPFAVSRDFFRRFAYARLEITNVLKLDLNVAALQLLVLIWLGYAGMLSAVTAFGAIGLACTVAVIVFLYRIRSELALRFEQLRAIVRRSWNLGKWLVVAQVMIQVQGFVTYWLTLAIAGSAATGVYAACMTIVSVTNPLVNGLGNLLLPKLVLAWKQQGAAGLRRRAIQDSLLLGSVMAPLCILVLVAGEEVLQLLYPGSEYAGHGPTTAVLAFATLAAAVGMPASYALTSMEKPRSVLIVNTIGALLTVILVASLTVKFGTLGAAGGWMLGNIVVAAGLWLRLLSLVSQSVDTEGPVQVLLDLDRNLNPQDVDIVRLAEGGESHVYAVQSKGNAPILGERRGIIFKIYKPGEPTSLRDVKAQFAALSRLNENLDGIVANDWTVSVPRPLHICESPLALAMTAVAGKKDLKSGVETDNDLTPKALQDLARIFVFALRKLWDRGLMHGDLGLQNVLYNDQSTTLSFIDPGVDDHCLICMSPRRRWHPAVLELGHVVRDFGTDVKDLLGNPMARRRRQVFVECAIRNYLDTVESPAERLRMLDEIREVALCHLELVLKQKPFSNGPFRSLVTRLVVRRISPLLERIRNDINLRADRSASPIGA